MSGISVELVDAFTKQQFLVHEKDENIYVEAEPNAEYFIKLECKDHRNPRTVIAQFHVDGVYLGYESSGDFILPSFKGCWSRLDGVDTMKALRFGRVSVGYVGARPVDISRGSVGTVSVEIYEAFEDGEKEVGNHSLVPGLSLEVGVPLTHNDKKKKMVRTELGEYSRSKVISGVRKAYRKGRLLETVTLKYATALGLIRAGVLPKPPFWDHAKLQGPPVTEIDPELARIQPTIIKETGLEAMGIKGKEYECFDLTHLE